MTYKCHVHQNICIFCLNLGIPYIELGFSARDMQIRIAKLGIVRDSKIARAMWNFGVGISARAKVWLSPSIEFWLLIFRRLPVFLKKNTLPSAGSPKSRLVSRKRRTRPPRDAGHGASPKYAAR